MARMLFLQNHDYEFLGPMYISAAVKQAGHDCRLSIGAKLKEFAPTIESYRPDLVAFSVMSGSHWWAMEMAQQVKKAYGIRSLFGGPHPTFYEKFAEEEAVDIAVRGQGEEAVVDILDRIAAGQDLDGIANVCFKRNGQLISHPLRNLREDLDTLPFADRNLYPTLGSRADQSVRSVIASRGCPYSCSFCQEDTLRRLYLGKGKSVRFRHIESVVAECKELRDKYEAKTILFYDDTFGVNRKWLYEFLSVYKKEVGLPFICEARADVVAADPEYAPRLAAGGCCTACFGIESGNEDIRNRVLNKRLSDEEIYLAAERLHAAGIKFRTFNMMGLPDETLDDCFLTLKMNIRVKADYPFCSVYNPYPGTVLADYSRKKGYLDPNFDFMSLPRSRLVSSPLNMPDIRRMQNLQKFFQTGVFCPWTLPLIKRLIRLPPNPLFTLWFGFVFFLVYVRNENRSFWQTLRFALNNAKHILKK